MSAAAPFRYGIIGCGVMGLEHIRNIALIEHAKVTAIADTSPKMRHLAVKTLGEEAAAACTMYEDYAELLADPNVDGFIIATPNCHHITVLRDAIPVQKHILCEKPLCTTMQDINEVRGRREGGWQQHCEREGGGFRG